MFEICDDMIYGTLKGTPYYGKCPDLLVDGIWYEHEGFCGEKIKRSFRNMCKHGFKQSNRVIIEDCGLTNGYMLRSIGGQQKAGIKISEMWIHRNGKYKLLLSALSLKFLLQFPQQRRARQVGRICAHNAFRYRHFQLLEMFFPILWQLAVGVAPIHGLCLEKMAVLLRIAA